MIGGELFFTLFLSSRGKATAADVVRHIDYLVNVGGIDSVGLGSDFDGISDTPEGLDNCSQTHIIAALLAKRDYSEDAIEKK